MIEPPTINQVGEKCCEEAAASDAGREFLDEGLLPGFTVEWSVTRALTISGGKAAVSVGAVFRFWPGYDGTEWSRLLSAERERGDVNSGKSSSSSRMENLFPSCFREIQSGDEGGGLSVCSFTFLRGLASMPLEQPTRFGQAPSLGHGCAVWVEAVTGSWPVVSRAAMEVLVVALATTITELIKTSSSLICCKRLFLLSTWDIFLARLAQLLLPTGDPLREYRGGMSAVSWYFCSWKMIKYSFWNYHSSNKADLSKQYSKHFAWIGSGPYLFQCHCKLI